MMISNVELEFKEEHAKEGAQSYGSWKYPYDLPIKPVFGTVSKWGFEGNPDYNIKSFYRDFNVIDMVKQLKPLPGDTLDLNSDISIEWIVDEEPMDSILIWIISQYEVFYFQEKVPDNGKYTIKAPGLNTGNNAKRERYCQMSMKNFLRNLWNEPNKPNSPYKYFSGVLYPIGVDSERNVIYEYRKYNEKKS